MSDSNDGPATRRVPDIDELANANPKVDPHEIQKAGELLKHLRDEGLSRPTYGLASPHARRTTRPSKTSKKRPSNGHFKTGR